MIPSPIPLATEDAGAYTLLPVSSFEECRDLLQSFSDDPVFSDPMLSTEEQRNKNLKQAIAQPERHLVMQVWRGQRSVGLFAFLVLAEERYLEMLVGLSREPALHQRILQELSRRYPAYTADFVFNPANFALKEALTQVGAAFDPEQQTMVLRQPVLAADTTGVVLLSPEYEAAYYAMHNTDLYWTGEKVAAASDRFRVLLALDGNRVVGYLDVTYGFEENEPYDLFVLPAYRRRGHARRMLSQALAMNQPKGMMLLVDVDNEAAIRLYEAAGFATVPGRGSLTAHWSVPAEE